MTKKRLIATVVCFSFAAVGFLSGCGGGSGGVNLADVSGVVLKGSAPVPDATVTFIPDKGPVAVGVTDLEGKFTLRTGTRKGAVLGTHRATVTLQQVADSSAVASGDNLDDPEALTKFYEQTMEKMESEESEAKSLLDPKYGSVDSSGLSFDVKGGEANDFTINVD